jgi:hypothetical protein
LIVCIVMVQDQGWYRPLIVTDSSDLAAAQLQAWAVLHPESDAYIQPCLLNEPVVLDEAVWSVEGTA